MKDEEMAEEYADKMTRDWSDGEYSFSVEELRQAFLAGLKAGRPQWHDLRKDKNDLPKSTGDYVTNIGVLTYDHYGNGVYKWHTPFCEACDYSDEVSEEVIAWCEIPTFDKE